MKHLCFVGPVRGNPPETSSPPARTSDRLNGEGVGPEVFSPGAVPGALTMLPERDPETRCYHVGRITSYLAGSLFSQAR